MGRVLVLAFLVLAASEVVAGEVQAVFAQRMVRVGAVVTGDDVGLRGLPEHQAGGVATRLEEVVGQEVRRSLYANRPIRLEDLGAPTIVRRNSLVTMAYQRGRIALATIGRALDDGGFGELVRVVNVHSRQTVVGTVAGPDLVQVGPAAPAAGSAR